MIDKNRLGIVAIMALICVNGCEDPQKMDEVRAKEYADRYTVCINSIQKYGYQNSAGYLFDNHNGICLCNNEPCANGCTISGKCNICDKVSCDADMLMHCVDGEQFGEKCDYGCFYDESDKSFKCRECTSGTSICIGDSLYQSCENGKWSDIKSCKADELCNLRKQGTNKCDNNCEKGSQICVDNEDKIGTIKKCEGDKYVNDDAIVCSGSCYTENNSVKCDRCINGETKCDDENYQECIKGTWSIVESCGKKGCDTVSGKCNTKICKPGKKECNAENTAVRICNNDGSAYDPGDSCKNGCNNGECISSEDNPCGSNDTNIYTCLSDSSSVPNFVTACFGTKAVFIEAGSCEDLNKLLQETSSVVVAQGNNFQGCYTFKDDFSKSFEIKNDGSVTQCTNGCNGVACQKEDDNPCKKENAEKEFYCPDGTMNKGNACLGNKNIELKDDNCNTIIGTIQGGESGTFSLSGIPEGCYYVILEGNNKKYFSVSSSSSGDANQLAISSCSNGCDGNSCRASDDNPCNIDNPNEFYCPSGVEDTLACFGQNSYKFNFSCDTIYNFIASDAPIEVVLSSTMSEGCYYIKYTEDGKTHQIDFSIKHLGNATSYQFTPCPDGCKNNVCTLPECEPKCEDGAYRCDGNGNSAQKCINGCWKQEGDFRVLMYNYNKQDHNIFFEQECYAGMPSDNVSGIFGFQECKLTNGLDEFKQFIENTDATSYTPELDVTCSSYGLRFLGMKTVHFDAMYPGENIDLFSSEIITPKSVTIEINLDANSGVIKLKFSTP